MKRTFGADLGELAGDDIRQWQRQRGDDLEAVQRGFGQGKIEAVLSAAALWIRSLIGQGNGNGSCRPRLTIQPADLSFSDPSLSHATQPNSPTQPSALSA